MSRKSEFWWASIHGADPEPVEKTKHEGRPCIFTLGCADPFYLDDTPPIVEFICEHYNTASANIPHAISRPELPATVIARTEAMEAARAKGRVSYAFGGKRYDIPGWTKAHGWRGPR